MNLRRFLWLVVIIILILSAFRIINKVTQKKVQEERIIPVMVSTPRIGEIEYRVTLTGDIQANTEVNVRPRVTGRVEEIYVKEGDYVNKGDKLLAFVPGISEKSDIYEDMIVRAPISGVIGLQQIKEGEQVTSSVGNINPVFTLYDVRRVKIYADVSEKDYSLIKKGTSALIKIDAFPDQTFQGRVTRIRPVIDPLSRTTQVEIVLPNSNQRIKPGMFAKVDLILIKKSKVLIIPFDVVLGETDKYVFVSQSGKAAKKPIVLGLQQDDNIEVKSGLSAQDRVIVLGERVVKEGSSIEEATGQ